MSWTQKLLMLVGCHCTFILINYAYYVFCIGGWRWTSIITGFNAHTNLMCSSMLEINSILSLAVKGSILGIILEVPKKLIGFINIYHTSS